MRYEECGKKDEDQGQGEEGGCSMRGKGINQGLVGSLLPVNTNFRLEPKSRT